MLGNADRELDGYRQYLGALKANFPSGSLPPVVWQVAEADANALMLPGDPPFEDPYLVLKVGSDFGLSNGALDAIRDVIVKVYFCRDDDSLDCRQVELWQLCRDAIPAPDTDSPPSNAMVAVNEPTQSIPTDAGRLLWGEKGVGLQSRKQWCIELAACKAFGRSAASVARLGGTIYEPHVDSKTGTFYLGSSTVEKLTGLAKKSVDGWRKQLFDNGWLNDTGERKGRSIVWELRLPDCQCGNHGRYVRPSANDDGGSVTPYSR